MYLSSLVFLKPTLADFIVPALADIGKDSRVETFEPGGMIVNMGNEVATNLGNGTQGFIDGSQHKD